MTAGRPRSRRPRNPAPAADAPLVWNVAGLLGETAGAVRDYAVEGVRIADDDEVTLAGPIEGRVHLGRTNRGLLVDADFTTSLATQCARCLRDLVLPLAFEIHDEALPAIDIHSGKALAMSPEDEEAGVIRLTDHHELDLEQPIREAILLAAADRAARSRRLPGALHRLRAAARRGRPRPPRRRHRSAPRGPARLRR